jgi:hypothetical protein
VNDLQPIQSQPGCWDPWPAQFYRTVAWDEGDSILFRDGLDLPKAPGFHSDVPTHQVSGLQAWTVEVQARPPFTVCANSSGQVEWLMYTPIARVAGRS